MFAFKRFGGGGGSARGVGRRAGAVGLLVLSVVGVVSASGWRSVPLSLADGSAWLLRGGDLVRGSSASGEADWLIEGVVDGEGADQGLVGQAGDVAMVVDGVAGRAFTIDAVTLELGGPVEVASGAVPFVGGGEAYLVSDGLVRWLDPMLLEEKAVVEVVGRVEAAIDGDGVLWTVTPRDGVMRKIVAGEVVAESQVTGSGQDLAVTLVGDRPVVVDVGSGRVWFVDAGDARAGDVFELGVEGVAVQGPSPFGERVWLAAGDRVLGVGSGGHVLEVPVGGEAVRPEVVEDRVVVPVSSGEVVVLDESSGEVVARAPLPVASEDDFTTFVKDGEVWFNSPGSGRAGTVGPDGTVQEIRVDEDGLRHRQEGRVDPNEPLEWDVVGGESVLGESENAALEGPPSAPPVTAPAPAPAPAPPPPAPGPVPDPEPVSTTATPVETTTTLSPDVDVPDVEGLEPGAACAAVDAAGLVCTRETTGEYATPANTVVGQEPAAGTVVGRGGTVTVRYHESEGVVVPQAGARGSEACAPIEAAGLVCNLVGQRSSSAVEPDQVLGQQPGAGERVGPGATVNVTRDNHPWAMVYQFRNPSNYELVFATSADARPGWQRTEIGRIFTEQAPGTIPLTCWEPDGTGENQSNAYSVDPGMGSRPYIQACGTVGYVPTSGGGPNGDPIYVYVGGTDHYYSRSASDPIGQRDYLSRPVSDTGEIFRVFSP